MLKVQANQPVELFGENALTLAFPDEEVVSGVEVFVFLAVAHLFKD